MTEEFNHLPELAKALRHAASQLMRKACFDIQANAAAAAPVDTGFMKSALYVITGAGDNTYGQGVGNGPLLPPVEAPTSETEGVIAGGAEYTAYVELGTSRMPARPFLLPAAESEREPFEQAFSRLEDLLSRGSGAL